LTPAEIQAHVVAAHSIGRAESQLPAAQTPIDNGVHHSGHYRFSRTEGASRREPGRARH
jgi:hypothetical protein